MSTVALEAVTVVFFAPLVGEQFGVSADEGAEAVLTLILEQAELVRSGQSTPRPFSLIFSGPNDMLLDQQIVWLSNPAIGDIQLFIVPISSDQERCRYQAIFN